VSFIKYPAVRDEIRKDIEERRYKPNERIPSDDKLVARFGVSRMTIIHAIHDLEDLGYLRRKAGSGTYVCANLPSPSSLQYNRVFGILMPDLGEAEIFEPVTTGITRAGELMHNRMLWGPEAAQGRDAGQKAEDLCRYFIGKVSGVFFAPLEHTPNQEEVNRRIAAALTEANIPIVLVDRCFARYPDRSKYDLVGIDNIRAGFRMTRHLVEAGCRRVVFASRPGAAATVDARCAGYREALWRSRIEPQPPFLLDAGDHQTGEVRRFIDAVKPDGIVCANDFTAARLMQDILTLGIKIPEQIKMVGINDVKYAAFLPVPLTTLRQPCKELGAAAMKAMLERLRDRKAPARDILLDCELVVRQSCGTAPNTEAASG